MLSVYNYIEKAKECQNFVYNYRMGVPYFYGDSTFNAIKQNAMDCLFNGCKAILTQQKIPVSVNREEAIQYVRTNHEIGCLVSTALNCLSEWEYNTLNRNDNFAEMWLHDLIYRLQDYCVYLQTNIANR